MAALAAVLVIAVLGFVAWASIVSAPEPAALSLREQATVACMTTSASANAVRELMIWRLYSL